MSQSNKYLEDMVDGLMAVTKLPVVLVYDRSDPHWRATCECVSPFCIESRGHTAEDALRPIVDAHIEAAKQALQRARHSVRSLEADLDCLGVVTVDA